MYSLRKSIHKDKLVIFVVTFTIIFGGCNKKEVGEKFDDRVLYKISVVDESGNPVIGAKIGLYDASDKYENGVINNNTVGYVQQIISRGNPNEDTLLVEPNTDYWLLVTYYDSTKAIKLSNESKGSKLNKFDKSTIVEFKVVLSATESNITFWTPTKTNVPITIKINNQTKILTDSSQNPPTSPYSPPPPHTQTFSLPAGEYTYQASSPSTGCAWAGKISIINGQFYEIQIPTCQRAIVPFFIPVSTSIGSSGYPVRIFIDNNSVPVGTIDSTVNTIPVGCGLPAPAHVFYAYLEPGTHTYRAVTANNNCVWTNNFTATAGCNPPIAIHGNCP
ncbi:MAG: hypothetical protein NZ529_05765 [Cytophagaceae bacterium]|nr:hypothetical protein [Cytophagaceae bacterium]MDW8456284.1 hypothetical protein [Cytophagaceae bacterium]